MSTTPQPAGSPPAGPPAQRAKHAIPNPTTAQYLWPPLQFGTWTGAGGIVAGIAGSIARESSPVTGGFVSGVQWFALGSTFWFTRILTIQGLGHHPEHLQSTDKLKVSTIAGSITGALSGALRGPVKILPSMLLWGVIGLSGQGIANRYEASKNKPKDEQGGFMRTWSPLKKLTDDEYLDMLNDKVLKAEVDIALIDDKIAELRQVEERQKTQSTASPLPPQKSAK